VLRLRTNLESAAGEADVRDDGFRGQVSVVGANVLQSIAIRDPAHIQSAAGRPRGRDRTPYARSFLGLFRTRAAGGHGRSERTCKK